MEMEAKQKKKKQEFSGRQGQVGVGTSTLDPPPSSLRPSRFGNQFGFGIRFSFCLLAAFGPAIIINCHAYLIKCPARPPPHGPPIQLIGWVNGRGQRGGVVGFELDFQCICQQISSLAYLNILHSRGHSTSATRGDKKVIRVKVLKTQVSRFIFSIFLKKYLNNNLLRITIFVSSPFFLSNCLSGASFGIFLLNSSTGGGFQSHYTCPTHTPPLCWPGFFVSRCWYFYFLLLFEVCREKRKKKVFQALFCLFPAMAISLWSPDTRRNYSKLLINRKLIKNTKKSTNFGQNFQGKGILFI